MAVDKKQVLKKSSLLTLCKEFGGKTSMHGIGRALNNRNVCSRILWSVITAAALGVASYQFVITVIDFYTYPVTTVVTLKQETTATFPGITICNLNRKRRSKINPDVLKEILNFTEAEEAPEDTYINVLMQRSTSIEIKDAGHQIKDMLLKCLYNRERCSTENFETVYTATYGTCHTFETHLLFKSATRPGPQRGLILELNIEQYEYLPITSRAGVKVIVHPIDETPFPEDGGILAEPGSVTSIGIKKTATRGLPSPYSNCAGPKGEGSSQRILFDKYTQTTCMKSCYQLTLKDKCGCYDIEVPCPCDKNDTMKGIQTDPDETVAFCNDTESLNCENDIEDKFLRGELECDERCPPACDSTTFDTAVSTALWPSDSYFDAFVKHANATFFANRTHAFNTSMERFVHSNFLRLEIFLESLQVIELIAQPKYDWNMLLGTLGGQMGLWLGFSLLTALEIVELLADAVFFCIRRRSKKKDPTPAEEH